MYKWFSIIAVILWTLPAIALDENEKRAWKSELEYLSKRHITYTWGAADESKADCSGIIYRSLKHIRPEIRRTTAIEMWKGQGGWAGREIKTDDADDLDLIWFSWKEKPDRPFGHIGVVYIPRGGVYSIFHASSTKKRVIIDEYSGKLKSDTAGLKRLTIGGK